MRAYLSFLVFFAVTTTRSFAEDPEIWKRYEIKQGDQKSEVMRLLRFHQCQKQRLAYSKQAPDGIVTTSPSDSFYLPKERKWLVLHFDKRGQVAAIDIAMKREVKSVAAMKDQFVINRAKSYRFEHEELMTKISVGDEIETAITKLEQDWLRKASAGAKGPHSYLVGKRWVMLHKTGSQITSILVDGAEESEITVAVLRKREDHTKKETEASGVDKENG